EITIAAELDFCPKKVLISTCTALVCLLRDDWRCSGSIRVPRDQGLPKLRCQRSGPCVFGALQFGAQFLCHKMRVNTIANDLRPDEHDQLCAGATISVVGKSVADRSRQLIEEGNAIAITLLALADEPCK